MLTNIRRNHFPTLYFILAIMIAALEFPGYAYWAGGVLLRDTHCVLTVRAVNDLNPADYPDIWRYSTPLACSDAGGHPGGVLIRGGSDERAHYELSLGRGRQFWFRNEPIWIARVLEQYTKFDFESAYLFLGYVAHLAEDSTVPAHAKVVFHGSAPPLADTYYYDPDASTPLPAEHVGIPLSDDLEYFTSNQRQETRNCPDDNPDCWDRRYPHRVPGICPNDPCTWKLWLSAAEEGRGVEEGWIEDDGPGRNWGGWGRGCRQDGQRCVDPRHYGTPCFGRFDPCSPFGDWYSRQNTRYPEVARGQLFLAHQRAREYLIDVSTLFPPIVRNFQLSKSLFTRQEGTTISFEALENRTQQVQISIQVVELDGQNLPLAGTDRPIVTQQGTWNLNAQQLGATSSSDRNRLPWESSFQLNWKGEVLGSALQANVDYGLWVKIIDGDQNESPDLPDGARGGMWGSLMPFRIAD